MKLRDMCCTPAERAVLRAALRRKRAWRALRLRVIQRDGYRCGDCGRLVLDTRKLQVHHLSYDRLGCEKLSDCHRRISTW